MANIVKNRVAIVVVFYNPTKDMVERANDFCKEYPVYVVDNSSTPICFNYEFNYFPLNNNLGIGEAQNIALSHLDSDIEFVLFLDQDSNMSIEEVSGLITNYISLEKEDNRLGAIGPLPVDISSGTPYKSVFRGGGVERYKRVGVLISSGTLVRANIFNIVGMMDETLFIDYVDFEWCWRLIDKGFHIYMTKDVVLRHQVGLSSFSCGGLSFIKSSPTRYYYRFRNFFYLVHRGYVPLKWKINTFIHNTIEFFLVAFIKTYKGSRLNIYKNILLGIKDGIWRKKTRFSLS